MALSITHQKTNNISDWTQADLDDQIALGNYPPGTLLNDITLPSDWNDDHTISGSIAWGEITGTLSDQADLQSALDAKQATGSYVTSVTGTANRITVTGTTTPAIDIASNYVGQNTITTLGTLISGATGAGFTVALGTSTVTGVLPSANGGAGTVNGLLKSNGSGTVSQATAGTDYTNVSFSTISVSGQSDVVADSAADTLTLVAGTNITLTTDAGADSITISASGGGAVAFSGITSGTNTTSAMVVGTGGSLDVSGSGTINATSVVAANEATDTTCFPLFVTAATGSLGPKTNANFTFNSNTGALGVSSLTLGAPLTVSNGGTGASTLTGVVIGNGTSAFTTVAAPSGTIVGTSDTQTLTNKRITPRVGTTTSSATPTINTDNVDFYSLTAQTVDITSFTTNLSGTPTNAQKLWIAITGTAARAITWGSSFEASTVALPTTTVSTDRLDVGFVWNSVSNKWRCVAVA